MPDLKRLLFSHRPPGRKRKASPSPSLLPASLYPQEERRHLPDRRRAGRALLYGEKHFEQAACGAAIGIWNWDPRTGDLAWSDRCRQLFGVPAGEPISFERFLQVLHPEDREAATTALQRALERHEDYRIQYRIRWPDGTVHWIEALGSGFYDEKSHAAVSMSGIALDITERKRREEALQERSEQLASRIEDRTVALGEARGALEDSNLELQQFAYIAAHDLQTPLRSLSGFAQLLQKEYRGRLDAQADIWLDQLIGAAQRMHLLIRDLLTYSGVASQRRPFRGNDMNEIFEEVVAAAEAMIRENHATVTRDDLPTVMGEPIQLAQLLQNLIENGIKYHGNAPPQVHVTARRQGGEWLFSVRDNGIGIAGKHHEQIFGIFRRLHTQQAYGGTGIGLAVCRRVIQRHGGRIWVDSEPGKGSTFHFTLLAE